MNTIRIASRVASYTYLDGLPHNGVEINKDILEIHKNHMSNNSIDILKTNAVIEDNIIE